MTIRARGNGWQADVSHGGKRYRRDFTGPGAKDEARAWEHETKAALLRGDQPDMGGPSVSSSLDTMRALCDATYERHWAGMKAEDTLLKNAQDCVEILGAGLRPSAVDERAVDGLVKELQRRGLSGGTINRKLAALSKMMTFGYSRGAVKRKPQIDRRKESEHRVRWYTDEEETKILGYFAEVQPRMVPLCILLVDTGLRLGEALRLTWQDVDLNKGVLTVWQSKGGKPRTIPLTTRVKAALAGKTPGTGEVFELTCYQCEHFWRTMRDWLGYEKDEQFVIHTFRHTFVSRLVQRGVDLRVVKELAGHATIQTTMRYAHLHPGNLVEAIGVLERKSA